MVLGTIKLDLHKTNVLVSISFRLLDLFDYRRGKYQLLRRSMSNEIDLSLHWVTHLFYFPLVFTMSNTPLCFPLVLTFLFCFFVCHWFARFLPSYFLYPACRLIVSRNWQMPTQNGQCLHGHLPHCQNCQKFHFCGPQTSDFRNELYSS